MVLIGVLLILLAVIVGLLLFVGTGSLTDTVDFQILGGTLSLPPVVLLVTGMVVISVFWLGWFLFRVGTTRARRRRVAAKESAREAEERRLADEARMKEEVAARERPEEERRRHEERETELRREADARVAEQHTSTETARRRAEVAEARASESGPLPATTTDPAATRTDPAAGTGTTPPPPPPARS